MLGAALGAADAGADAEADGATLGARVMLGRAVGEALGPSVTLGTGESVGSGSSVGGGGLNMPALPKSRASAGKSRGSRSISDTALGARVVPDSAAFISGDKR